MPTVRHLVVALAVVIATTAAAAAAAPTVLDAGGPSTSAPVLIPAVSGDGRVIAFASERESVVPDDTNGASDVFVHDRASKETTRVSVSSSSVEANGLSYAPAVSHDGRFVAFTSYASNLIDHDDNGMFDVFVHDRKTGGTTRVSVAGDGGEANGPSSYPAITADGRFVAFLSDATNLVPDDTNGWFDVFVHDRATGTTARVNLGSEGTQAALGAQFAPAISADGCIVAFFSASANLVAGDTNEAGDIFVHDCRTGRIRRVSVSSENGEADSGSFAPVVSADGRFVAFFSDAASLVADDTNGHFDVFVRDLLSGETTRVSVIDGGGEAPEGESAFPSLDGSGRSVAFSSTAGLVPDDTNGEEDVYVFDRLTGHTRLLTRKGDGGPALGESRGPSMSADGHFVAFSSVAPDLTSLGGSAAGGESLLFAPTAQSYKSYLAEGARSSFFQTRLALLNLGDEPAAATLRFQRGVGAPVDYPLTVAPHARATIDSAELPELADAAFSTELSSDQPLVMDRTMSWDRGGSHAETGLPSPAKRWYLAEGATHSDFALFYLIQNANEIDTEVKVRYLLPAPAEPIVRTYHVRAGSRFNIWVNQEPGLEHTDVSAVVTSPVPVIVERAMYLTAADRPFGAGHESAGVTAPATRWFLAEGATGPYFDLFVLVANPGATDAMIKATFLLPSGERIEKTYGVSASSRFNIWVDLEDARLADTAVSTTIESTNDVPVVVERAMWWPGSNWFEAHNSPGSTTSGTTWALAEGEVGGPSGFETYILIANISGDDAAVQVTLFFEDGSTVARTFTVAAQSRFNVSAAVHFPETANRRFGALVESTGPAPRQLIVEHAVYSNSGGRVWGAGTDALASRVR